MGRAETCRDGSRAIGGPLFDSDGTNMSHVPNPPSGRFLRLGFSHLGPGSKMEPPKVVPRWVSGYRPAPCGTVKQPTCHMFVIHLVEDYFSLGFPSWVLGQRWHSPRGYRDGSRATGPPPWGRVMQQTCHMFLIHLVEDCCALGFPSWVLGPRWYPPRGVPRWVSGYRADPWESNATNMSHVPYPHSGRFLLPWFAHLGPGPKIGPS